MAKYNNAENTEAEEKKMRARWDLSTLQEAASILKDKKRLDAAKKLATETKEVIDKMFGDKE